MLEYCSKKKKTKTPDFSLFIQTHPSVVWSKGSEFFFICSLRLYDPVKKYTRSLFLGLGPIVFSGFLTKTS